MIADIASGETDASDLLLLLAALLLLVSAVLAWSARALWPVLLALGLACATVGLLLL